MSSFDVTFLGHQGWLFAAGESRLLVDPLLTASMGHLGVVGDVYPPRVFSFEAFPAVDALLLTHEHEDHFDIPSLSRIDRTIPVLLSAHSSRAAHAMLSEMGFAVRRVSPGEVVTIGDLELRLFAPDLSDADSTDEWDVLPFLVRDRWGHGSFFTTIDVEDHARLEASLRAVIEQPSIWCYTNNVANFSFTQAGRVLEIEPPADTATLARVELDHYTGLCFRWARPEAVVMCGGGFSFAGERAWMNRHVFRADSEKVCASLAALVADRPFIALTPGQAVSFRGGALAAVRPESAFMRAVSRDQWPSRAFSGEAPLLESYAPFTDGHALERSELDDLERELAAFAAHLCSRRLFRELLSLERGELEGRRPTFALVALHDEEGGAYVYEYDLAACAFVRADERDPVADYVGGLECWASDLLAVLRGDLGASAISFGRGRSWNALPERCKVGWKELWLYAHPLRWPEKTLCFYRGMYERDRGAPVCVRGAERAGGSVVSG